LFIIHSLRDILQTGVGRPAVGVSSGRGTSFRIDRGFKKLLFVLSAKGSITGGLDAVFDVFYYSIFHFSYSNRNDAALCRGWNKD
jgi:hypothetical protein